MVSSSRILCIASLACAALTSAAVGQTIGNGHYSVTVNKLGVLTDIQPPGLMPTLGPLVPIVAGGTGAAAGAGGTGLVEWFGLEFDTVAGHVSAVGEGSQPDYAGRTPVKFVSQSGNGSEWTSVTSVGALEIQTRISFNPQGPELLIGVDLVNRGTTEITMIMYSREWLVPGRDATTFPPDWAPMVPPAPAHVHRILYMPNNLLPGRTQSLGIDLKPIGGQIHSHAVDVPLQLWTNSNYPNGLNFGATNGISCGDIDHDGWVDVVTCQGMQIWRNLGGVDWGPVGNIRKFLRGETNYGACISDYDNDNLPDIGTEPRSNCMHLLHNLGTYLFDDVANDPNIVDVQPCNAEAETLCTSDTDGDGNLDWFLPTYPASLGSSGNWFLYNLGPVGTGGAYTFHEDSAAAGLDNPPGVNRPEGAGFVDVDGDGDSDLYSNGTLYRDISTPGTPLFDPMTEVGSGIIHSDVLDEGAGFFDYDMDGDFDLCVAFCDNNLGVRMFEALGDGTFVLTKKTIFDSYNTGLCLGLSFEDWDNDGDVDVTSSEVFRRNQFVETGLRSFTVATHNIPPNDITDATPAWFDFDRDGDLDTALGNWFSTGHLYENYTYDVNTPADQRRYVRVKPVRDSANFDDGLETEFGAVVTVHPLGNSDDGLKRVKTCASSNGYLNQGEYAVHFALPADPDPSNPDVDLDFEVSVEFKGASSQGFPRVDRHVNPVLGDIKLATLVNREIVVYRSGRVRIDGADYLPAVPVEPLTTTTGGLLLAGSNAAIPLITPAPGADWFVGAEFSTAGAPASQRIEELILDGQLDLSVACGTPTGNLFVWDVTNASSPLLVTNGLVDQKTKLRNDRSYFPLDVTFEPNKVYRVVARVTALRATPVVAPVVTGNVTTNGGLSFTDATPCSGAGAAAATLDAANVYLALRFRDEPAGSWGNLGDGLAGALGEPLLAGSGTLQAGASTSIDLSNAALNAPLLLGIGTTTIFAHFAGGTVVPSLDVILPGTTDAAGKLSLSGTWPSGLPGGVTIYLQAFIVDATGPHGFAFSNAIVATTPY